MNTKRIFSMLPAFAVAVLAANMPVFGQTLTQRALDRCRDEAVNKLQVGRGNVTVEAGRVDRNDNLIVRFTARRGNWQRQGFCAVNKNIEIANFQVREQNNANSNSEWDLPAQGQQSGGAWGQQGSGGWGQGQQSGTRQSGRFNRGGQTDNRPALSNFHRVNVDTSGRGNFNGGNAGNVELTRGWVDTRSGRLSVAVSGRNNFKITFYGDIVEQNDRNMVMRINGSDRGNASGQASFVLNGDRNEVESITLTGFLDNSQFSGSFTRR